MRLWIAVWFLLACLGWSSAHAQSVVQSGTVTPNHAVKWITDGVAGDGGLGFTELVNGNFNLYLDTVGHLRITGSTPALTSCGTSPAITGTDIAGVVTMGTGSPTGCVITFATTYTAAPTCVVTSQSQLSSFAYSIAATAITTVQTGTSSNKLNYRCDAQSGG